LQYRVQKVVPRIIQSKKGACGVERVKPLN
jgi:hypothetical protein